MQVQPHPSLPSSSSSPLSYMRLIGIRSWLGTATTPAPLLAQLSLAWLPHCTQPQCSVPTVPCTAALASLPSAALHLCALTPLPSISAPYSTALCTSAHVFHDPAYAICRLDLLLQQGAGTCSDPTMHPPLTAPVVWGTQAGPNAGAMQD